MTEPEAILDDPGREANRDLNFRNGTRASTLNISLL